MRGAAACAAVAVPLAVAACGGDRGERANPPPRDTRTTEATGGPVRAQGDARLETVATGLDTAWEIAFLPDGRALITERGGTVRLLSRNLRLQREPVARVQVAEIGEGGLMGLAVDPDFESNRFVYLYRTTEGGNQVLRYRMEGSRLREQAVIARGIEAAEIHDGGRMRFGPDGFLYFTTGDANRQQSAQDPRSLNGKILRMPPRAFRGRGARPEVFSLGHRNPQGFDWQPGSGRMISDEHGPFGYDEINVIRRGANYGWPQGQGEDHGRFTAPLVLYKAAIAPSGATFVRQPGSAWTGDYLIGALGGEQIRRVRLEGDEVTVNEALFEGDLGRVRTVTEGPDGALYALTSNRDGRGTPEQGDDRVVRIVPPAG